MHVSMLEDLDDRLCKNPCFLDEPDGQKASSYADRVFYRLGHWEAIKRCRSSKEDMVLSMINDINDWLASESEHYVSSRWTDELLEIKRKWMEKLK